MNDVWIVHILSAADWLKAQELGEYRPDSLVDEGFIHCSRPSQVLSVANRFYSSLPGLVLLWIDPARLQTGLRWELSDGDIFPHIYGALNLEAVVAVTDFPPGRDGFFRRLPRP